MSSKLAGLAFILFLASLAAPAAEMSVLGKPADDPGWLAAWCALCMGFESVVDVLTKTDTPMASLGFVTVGASALCNTILLLPLAWFKRTRAPAPAPWRRVSAAWSLGMLLAILSPFACALAGLHATMRVGYGAWLAAWIALGAALLAARREAAALTS